jgi:fumarate reductase subunit D
LWSILINGRINGHNLHENTFMWILSSAGNHVKAIFVSVLIRVRFYRIR